MSRALRLQFASGTVLCPDWPPAPEQNPSRLPGMRWDDRVRGYRAPAACYAGIVRRALDLGIPLEDRVLTNNLRPGSFDTIGLRPYQDAALAAWGLNQRRGLLVLPTGSGKTRVALAAMAQLGVPSLCLVPTRVLMEQWRDELAKVYGGLIGGYGDGRRRLAAITLSTFASARLHMSRFGNRFQLLVVDEAHHFGCRAQDLTLQMSAAPYRLGLTATPPAWNPLVSLSESIGPTVFQLSLEEIQGGFLADFDRIELRLDLGPDERSEYDRARQEYLDVYNRFRSASPMAGWSDFIHVARQSLEGKRALRAWHRARKVLSLPRAKMEVLAVLLDRHRDARILVFTADREAAYRISRKHLIMPITSDISRYERKAALSAFRRGEIRALVSARVLNEGVDVPDADIGIVVGASQGVREHVQRVGRLLRPAAGKRALIYELVMQDTVEISQAQRRQRGLDSH